MASDVAIQSFARSVNRLSKPDKSQARRSQVSTGVWADGPLYADPPSPLGTAARRPERGTGQSR